MRNPVRLSTQLLCLTLVAALVAAPPLSATCGGGGGGGGGSGGSMQSYRTTWTPLPQAISKAFEARAGIAPCPKTHPLDPSPWSRRR